MRNFIGLVLLCLGARAAAQPAADAPPPVQREFRGVWLVTVGNGDWPSRPGLSTWEQQRELLGMLNKAAELHMNAIVFHIRPGADAIYDSPYEPWAIYLTGRQGRAPEPYWDPLKFAVEESHRRGMELHAWFNPYRAHYTKDTATAATNHIVRTNPELVHPYGRVVWMDPGEPEVRRRSLRAVTDVVKRYDIDGVHIDDYFYPYPEQDSLKHTVEFPDSATYARYVKHGGALSRSDWRRKNVDDFIHSFYVEVHKLKAWVKVGISPFGIWRPGNPPTIKGFDAYEQIAADSKKWFQEGWADYLTPQLYWAMDPPDQSYPVLLKWWTQQNVKNRHLWVGNYAGRVGMTGTRAWKSEEIARQIAATRAQAGATGNVHFPMNVFMKDPDSLDTRIAEAYAEPALVPASPWLGAKAPATPAATLTTDRITGDHIISLNTTSTRPWLWVVRTRGATGWVTAIVPGSEKIHRLLGSDAQSDVAWVSTVSRTGVESRVVMARYAPR